MRARVFLGLFLLFALAGPVQAQDRRASGTLSLGRILPEIRRNEPGTFYDAEGPFQGPDGRARYRIKWMTPDGRIIWFEADARTGHLFGRNEYGPPAPRTGGPARGVPHFGDVPHSYGGPYDYGRGDRGQGDRGHGGHDDRGPH